MTGESNIVSCNRNHLQ